MLFQTIANLLERHGKNLDDFAEKYGEPGYANPDAAILLANWNDIPKHIINGLERRGFELEWSDEWTCSNNKAYRTSGNCHGWTPYYVQHEGEIYGGDEIESGEYAEWYVEQYLLNDPSHFCMFNVKLSEFGFTMRDDEYETGFHPGQTDEPSKVYAELEGKFDVVFEHVSSGQFDCRWRVWTRPIETDPA